MSLSGYQLSLIGAEQAYSAKDEEWKIEADRAIEQTACELPFLDADDMWARFRPGYEKDNGSALGAAIRKAKAAGKIELTGYTRKAGKPSMHCKHRPVWRSKLYVEPI